MKTDYIPRKDADFDLFFRSITQYVQTKSGGTAPAWTHIPQADRTAVNDVYAAWYDAYALTLNPHAPQITREKIRVRLLAERDLRHFVNRFLRFEPVTDLDRDNMGVPNHDLIRTPRIEVTEMVEIDLKLRNIREILVNFKVKGKTGKAKPNGQWRLYCIVHNLGKCLKAYNKVKGYV